MTQDNLVPAQIEKQETAVEMDPESPSEPEPETSAQAVAVDEDKKEAAAETPKDAKNSNEEGEFPSAFYCPLTKKVFVDPVVDSKGNSYEKSALEEFRKHQDPETPPTEGEPQSEQDSPVYPNRALQVVIEEAMMMADASISAGLIRIQKNMHKSMTQLLEKTAIPSEEYRPLPDVYYCPITFELIHIPVIDPEGNTFEKAAILRWIQANENSPITRAPLRADQLYPNEAIRELLQEEKEKSDDLIHPSIRIWKDTEPPPLPEPTTADAPTVAIPLTPEELEERRRRHRNARALTMIAWLISVAALVLLFLYVPVNIFFFFAIYLIYTCTASRNRRRREEAAARGES